MAETKSSANASTAAQGILVAHGNNAARWITDNFAHAGQPHRPAVRRGGTLCAQAFCRIARKTGVLVARWNRKATGKRPRLISWNKLLAGSGGGSRCPHHLRNVELESNCRQSRRAAGEDYCKSWRNERLIATHVSAPLMAWQHSSPFDAGKAGPSPVASGELPLSQGDRADAAATLAEEIRSPGAHPARRQAAHRMIQTNLRLSLDRATSACLLDLISEYLTRPYPSVVDQAFHATKM